MKAQQFVVEGEERESETILKKRANAQKLAKKLRNFGQEYCSPKTKKVMPARFLRVGC